VIITYPTADTVEQEYFGDYGNLSLTLDVSAQSLLQTFGPKVGRALVRLRHQHTQRGHPRSLNELLLGALR
jgi:hypothetical protein